MEILLFIWIKMTLLGLSQNRDGNNREDLKNLFDNLCFVNATKDPTHLITWIAKST